MRWLDERKQICRVGTLLWERGHVAGYEGNISLRVDHGRDTRLLITPAGTCKGMLEPSDLLDVDLNAQLKQGSGKPSSESSLHTGVYRLLPDVRAVIHTHSPHATACSLLPGGLDTSGLPEAAASFGEVALVPWAAAGSQDLYYAARPLLAKHRALLLARHGLLCYSRTSLIDTFHLIEQVEHLAHIYLLGRSRV